MNENTQLIEEINNLRREVREQRDSISKKNNEKMANAAKSKVQQASQGGTNGGTNDGQDSFRQSTAEEQEEFEQQQLEGLKHEADVQRGYIAQIQKDLQKKIEQAQKLAEELAQAINGDQN